MYKCKCGSKMRVNRTRGRLRERLCNNTKCKTKIVTIEGAFSTCRTFEEHDEFRRVKARIEQGNL